MFPRTLHLIKTKETVILKTLISQWVCSRCNMTCFAETEHSCKMCCRRKDGTCSPFIQADGSFLFLRKGKPCTVGFCDEGVSSSSINRASSFGICFPVLFSRHLHSDLRLEQGKCMKQVQDVIERLWDFIDKLDINTFGKWQAMKWEGELLPFWPPPTLPSGKFLADNIVGSVVVFSLIFWIPLSILVHCVVRLALFQLLWWYGIARGQISVDAITSSFLDLNPFTLSNAEMSLSSFLLSVFRTSDLISSTRKTQSASTSHRAWVSSLHSVAIQTFLLLNFPN